MDYSCDNMWEIMNRKTSQTKLTDTKKLKIRNDFVQGVDGEEKKNISYTWWIM